MPDQTQPSAENEPELIWGARALAREFNLTERQFYHLASQKLLPGVDQFGRKYVGNLRRIRAIGLDPVTTPMVRS
jgi:hypothetical protein